ncbi:hypothetical protein ILUMI_18019 [Ignelater luminosus]|uniref:Uncharacterized protein n=1 Tax=Ignelater luminosus TaxID=2038154 RepID=A0A8K0CKP1_IGNLU|nr:hypothetical protein ILUMI_18019 [Ignelater luminosus]
MLYSITIFILCCMCLSIAKKFPFNLPRCYTDDPKLTVNECVLRAFNELRPIASNGIEDIGLPPLNPFVIPEIFMHEDLQMTNFTVTVFNYTIGGMDNYDIKEFQYDSESMTYRFRIEFETIIMSGSIQIDGYVVNIPIVGNAYANCTFGPVNATFEIKGSTRKSKGIDYYNTENVCVNLDVADGGYSFVGLFDNNKQLERMTNEMLNANSAMVTKAATPLFEKLAEVGIARFMKTLTKIPLHELFPSLHRYKFLCYCFYV